LTAFLAVAGCSTKTGGAPHDASGVGAEDALYGANDGGANDGGNDGGEDQGGDVRADSQINGDDEHTQPVTAKLRLGLRDYHGSRRPIWDAWKALKELSYKPHP
jgi:hypothetical protein